MHSLNHLDLPFPPKLFCMDAKLIWNFVSAAKKTGFATTVAFKQHQRIRLLPRGLTHEGDT